MLTPAIISFLVGLALAQRFKVLILIPVILLTLVFAIVAGLSGAAAGWASALTAVVTITGVQIGYLLGIALRHAMLLARAQRRRAGSLTRPLPPQWRVH
jgi:uncharacterized membrane protein